MSPPFGLSITRCKIVVVRFVNKPVCSAQVKPPGCGVAGTDHWVPFLYVRRCAVFAIDNPPMPLQRQSRVWERSKLVSHPHAPPFLEEFDEAAFLGDEGVDAGGFGVEVVSDRPLLSERWYRYRHTADIRCGNGFIG